MAATPPTVLLVGVGTAVESTLRDRRVHVQATSDATEALAALDETRVEAAVTAADAGQLSGVEFAAVAHERADVPVVVLGSGLPDAATAAAGVSAVCSPESPSAVADAVEAALSDAPGGALSTATLDALEALYELDSETQSVEAWLQAVARIGCERLDLPYGFVTRIDGDSQHIVAAVGDDDQLQAGNTADLREAYCRHTVEQDGVVGFTDVAEVDWVSDAAVEEFGLACYLGSRIALDSEDPYGTFCFADSAPRRRRFSAEETTFVKLLTQWVAYELARRERRSEIHLKNRAMDEAEVGITISDPDQPDNPIIYANEGFERVTGYPTESVVGRNCRFLQGPDTDPETVGRIRDAIEAGESVEVELRNYRPDGTEFWNRLGIHPITENGEVTAFVGFQRDVTERKQREQELLAYETAVNTAADSIYRLDSDGRFRMVSDAVCAMTGYDREELLGAPLTTLLSDRDAARTERRIADGTGAPDQGLSSLTVTVRRRDGTTFPAETRLTPLPKDGDGGAVLVTRDISDRRAHERTLTELHDVSRTLLGAQNRTEISETIAAAADEILDIEASAVYRFDDRANRLVPEAVPESTTELLGELPEFGPGDSIAWDAFVAGERRVYDDVTADPDAYNPETPIRSELLSPIGDYGLLVCGSTAAGVYDQATAELADLLAANAQAAYDRMERDQRLYRRERELREQNRRLERLDAVNDRVRRICHALVGATTREEIAELVCDGLADIDQFAFVWLGEFDYLDGAVEPVATAGAGSGYLDAVSLTPDADTPEPTLRAATGGDPVFDNRVAAEFRRGDWQQAALNRDYRAVCSLPLRHNGVPYGTLSVYADAVDAFDEETRTVLSDLAETAAHNMAVAEQRRALLSDGRVQLVFGLGTQPTTVFTLADELGGTVTVDRMIPRSDGGTMLYGDATGIDGAALEAYCAESPGIETATVTDTGDGTVRFELHVTGPCIGTMVADHGGSFGELRIEDGRGRLVVTFPTARPVGDFNRLFTERYDGVELLARREQGTPSDDETETAPLTDRQREALAVAYERGFYEWPREHTGEEIAESLDITAPTFLEHLRRAESKIVADSLERDPLSDDVRSD